MTAAAAREARRGLPPLLRALRPSQWTKNGIVFVAYFFARWDPGQRAHAEGWEPLALTVVAAALFCALSSAVYLVNDIHDRAADRAHPQKRLRPLASGALSMRAAAAAAAALAAAALAAAFAVNAELGALAAAYLALQAVYTYGLRRVAFVDAFIIAAGFVIRAVAGAVAIAVRISPWLLLCAFLLALFLALCKRRHEKRLLTGSDTDHRQALGGYTEALLDQLIADPDAHITLDMAEQILGTASGQHVVELVDALIASDAARGLDLINEAVDGGADPRQLGQQVIAHLEAERGAATLDFLAPLPVDEAREYLLQVARSVLREGGITIDHLIVGGMVARGVLVGGAVACRAADASPAWRAPSRTAPASSSRTVAGRIRRRRSVIIVP